MRTMIVEDEPHARALLASILRRYPHVQVVAEAADGATAVEQILNEQPDVVFLDVQIPELDGFEVLDAVRAAGENLPAVVFVTAYDQYALRAFDVHALDYLLKPFDGEAVDRALRRASTHLEHEGAATLSQRLGEMLAELRAGGRRRLERIPVRSNGRVRFVNVAEIDWIEADDHVLHLHVGRDHHVLRDSLASLEARLDPAEFLRVHRGAIVNVRRIREVQPWFQGDYVVVLADGTKLTSGRTYRENVRRLLELPEVG